MSKHERHRKAIQFYGLLFLNEFVDSSISRSWVLSNDSTHSLFVLDSVSLKQVICFSLRRRLGVGVVEQILDTQHDLLHGNRGLPGFFLVENRQTDGARGIYVGMKERWNKLA